MSGKNNQDESGTERRDFIKTLGVAGVGMAGVGMAGVGVTSDDVAACATYNGCDRTSLNTTYDAYIGHTTHLGSSIERKTISSHDGYWTHTFKLAGDGIAMEDGSPEQVVTSQDMIVENNSTDYLSVFTSQNERETGMMPESSGGNGDGGAVVDVATGVLSAAATAVKSTAGSYALAAEAIAEGLINLFSDYSESGNTYSFTGSYGSSGIDKGGHHLRFKVDEYEDGDPYAQHTLQVRSQYGLAINGWDVSFGDRGVVFSGNDASTQDYRWTAPAQMTTQERDHFGVEKVDVSALDEYEREAVDTSEDYVYVAQNAPVSVSPITQKEKKKIRKQKQKELDYR